MSAIGEAWLMHNADVQQTLGGEGRGPNGQKKKKTLDLSCLALKHEFYFITTNTP